MNIKAGLGNIKKAMGARQKAQIERGPKTEQKEFVTSEVKRDMLSLRQSKKEMKFLKILKFLEYLEFLIF